MLRAVVRTLYWGRASARLSEDLRFPEGSTIAATAPRALGSARLAFGLDRLLVCTSVTNEGDYEIAPRWGSRKPVEC